MKLLLINQTKDRMPRQWLALWLKTIANELQKRRIGKAKGRELVLVFVPASEIKRLNKQYRGKDYATDVLSFASGDPEVLGELALCWSVIRKQSRRTGLSERQELGYMILHGVLHLLGYDHENPADEAEMFALQDDIFSRCFSK